MIFSCLPAFCTSKICYNKVMNPIHSRRARFALRLSAVGLLAAASLAPIQAAPKAAALANPAPVEALLYSTMPSTAAHRPQMAMDGDASTYFQTVYGMGDGDDFLMLLSRAIPVQSLHIVSGTPEGDDLLTNAIVETSVDGVTFTKAASFTAAGVADANLKGAPVAFVKIRLNPNSSVSSLALREVTLTSPEIVTHVAEGPGRGFYDISAAPDLAAWAKKAEQQMEDFWPDTDALLYSDDFIPPNMVNVIYKTGPNVTGVAATGGGVMTINSAWARAHADDTGLTVHETAHVIQAMSAYNPVWLIEGTADYIRWIKFEPQNFTYRIDPKKSTYHDAYRTTAAFLAYCELHYDSGLVTKLNAAVRFGKYDNSLFKTYCGKDVDTLWSEFVAAYVADPKGVLLPPMAAADRPRTLPTVTAGSSKPVSLAAAFNSTGVFADGQAPGTGGVDGEGSAYSAAFLSGTKTCKDVQFQLGPAGGNNLVACAGQVVPVNAGPVNAGPASSLWLMAAAVEGSQMAQTLTVTYTDGTTDTLSQNFSDWFQPRNFPGEVRAVRMPYRLLADGSKDQRTFYVYGYGFALNPAKTVKSVTLPNNKLVKVLAMTLAN